jgi:hypothetical protein
MNIHLRGPPGKHFERYAVERRVILPLFLCSANWRRCMLPIFLSVEQFLEHYPVGRTRLYEDIREGRIRIVKSGRRTLIPSSELRRLEVSATADAHAVSERKSR